MNKTYKIFFLLATGCFALLFHIGCGQHLPDGMPPIYPCKITFTQEGKPVFNASVILHPVVQSDKYWAISSVSDVNGVTMLSTNGNYKGVPAGTYKVTVEKILPEAQGSKGYYLVDSIDIQYRSVDTTPIQVEVNTNKKQNVFSFDLGKETQTRVSQLIED
ncbi:MAG: hypothetical protein LBB88_02385 [Planctomycetaceae bacterium]|jgi:hypothetical protein|nr:hypothetical protein [Planctomycetaceae bacterium]